MSNEIFDTVTNTKVVVGTESTAVLAEVPARNWAIFVNDSDEAIYLSLGSAATLNAGIRLNANGGSFELTSDNNFKGAVYAICTNGSKNLCVAWGI